MTPQKKYPLLGGGGGLLYFTAFSSSYLIESVFSRVSNLLSKTCD